MTPFKDDCGNERRLVWKFRKVPLMKFGVRSGYWHKDGFGRGILVETRAWHGEVWYERPEHQLRWRSSLPPPLNAPTE